MSSALTTRGEASWGSKIAYVSASTASGAFHMILTAMVMIYYSPPGGQGRDELLPIVVTSTVLGVGKILDAFADPVVAYLSDRTRSRLGRRIPWIIAGILPLGIFFMGLWYVPPALRHSGAKVIPQLSRTDMKMCQTHIKGLRGKGEVPVSGWFDKAQSEPWFDKCQHLADQTQKKDARSACMREMERLKSKVKGTKQDWQKLVGEDSRCTSYGKGCPLFPKDQEVPGAGEGHGGKGGVLGSFFRQFGQHWKVAVWLMLMSSGFWLSYTVVFVPHLALMPVIARTDKSRMAVNLLLAIFNILGVLLLQQILRGIFTNVLSFPDMSLPYFATVALVAMVLIALTPLFVREPLDEYTEEEHYGLWESFKWSFLNRAFIIYSVSTLFLMVGFTAVLSSIEYVVPLLLHREAAKEMTKVYALIIGSVMLSFGVMVKMAGTVDKKLIYGVSLFAMAAVMPLLYLLGEPTIFGMPTIYFAYGVFFFIGVPVAGVMSLQNTVLADIIDEDEIKTGLRREAMFFGSEGLIRKGTAAIVPLMMGKLFEAYGYCHPTASSNMGVRYLGPTTAFFVLIGAVAFVFYPIRERELREKRMKYLAAKASSEKP